MNYHNINPSQQSTSPSDHSPGSGLTTTPNKSKPRLSKDPKAKLGLLVAAVLLVVLVAALILVHNNKNKTTTQSTTPATPQAQVTITQDGFIPQTLSVKAGTEVTWKVTDTTTTHEIASDPYPKDDSLPALKSIQLGQNTSYSYKFTQKGTVNYHDDLNPTSNGTVVVE